MDFNTSILQSCPPSALPITIIIVAFVYLLIRLTQSLLELKPVVTALVSLCRAREPPERDEESSHSPPMQRPPSKQIPFYDLILVLIDRRSQIQWPTQTSVAHKDWGEE
ncbi:hypothetical protein F5Y04DRAFT_274991 [Hypomontagnella monticulosa]|nr:hypothetical protein F5Y04DRAFT_274991 [Hypomontagnella monticulosa]